MVGRIATHDILESIATMPIAGIILSLLAPAIVMADPQADADPAPRSSLLTAVTRCQSITDPGQRLTCYDQAVRPLDAAAKNREIVIVDKAQVRQTRKTLFGLTLPRLGIFGDAKDGADDEIKQIDTTLARADLDNGGGWMFTLADGARWRQMDDNVLGKRPRAGDKVVVRRAALGSFKLSIAGQPAVKVRREN